MADEMKPDAGDEAEARPKAEDVQAETSAPEADAVAGSKPPAKEGSAADVEAANAAEAEAGETKAGETKADEAKAEAPKANAAIADSTPEPAVAAFTADDGDAGGDHEPMEVEADRPPTGAIAVAIVLSVGAIIAVVVGINEVFRSVIGNELTEKVYDYPSAELRQLRAEESQKLGRYQFASKKDGVVRVPLDRAMALTMQDYAKREPAPAPAPPPGAQPSAAPAAGPEVKEHK